ncbi:MAG: hypothetical protein IIC78_06125 [Chloroflexi bacterium]|nr:hypothetical protein [Chloroflexota bacterium]
MKREQERKFPGALAERLFTSMSRLRRAWPRHHRPEDLRQLIRIFPNVKLSEGYVLDYLPMGGPNSRWIWPYARPKEDDAIPNTLAAIARDQLIGMRESAQAIPIEIQTLYRHLTYPSTVIGVFEYAIFIKELWATKSEAKENDWLSMQPIFSRASFENWMRKAGEIAKRIDRPANFEPFVEMSPGSRGEVRFLAYESQVWKRITWINLRVDPSGFVRRSVGRVMVDMGQRRGAEYGAH